MDKTIGPEEKVTQISVLVLTISFTFVDTNVNFASSADLMSHNTGKMSDVEVSKQNMFQNGVLKHKTDSEIQSKLMNHAPIAIAV